MASMNLLYCFDENYNVQAFNSISSFIENNNCEISVYILHNNPESFKEFQKKLKSKDNVKELDIKKFLETSFDFPNLHESHVSEATYYRLFIAGYIPEYVDSAIYVDADVICINNFYDYYNDLIKRLRDSDKTIAARNAPFRDEGEKERLMKALNIKNNYFNAGVMFIDLKKWRNLKIEDNLIKILKSEKNNIKFWDQDVLNKAFDGDYIYIDYRFNFIVDQYTSKKQITDYKDILLLHYAGSFKPWTVRGVLNDSSEFYQKTYFKSGSKNYHITHTWKLHSLSILLKSILTFKIFKIYKPVNFFITVIKSFFKFQ
jgi:UDP-glucose:(galactosyl)LPS alpha-1,2-glucosyltransferase